MKKVKSLVILLLVFSLLFGASLPASAAERATEAKAGSRHELIELREKNVKAYQLEDGLIEYEVFASNIHYLDDNEKYQEIDSRIVDIDKNKNHGYKLKNCKNDWDVFFADKGNSQDMVKLNKGKYNISFSMEKAKLNAKADKSTNLRDVKSELHQSFLENQASVLYNDIMDNVDLAYTVRSGSLKEDIIFNSVPGENKFTFIISVQNLTLILKDSALEYRDKKTGETIFSTSHLYMEDGSGKVSHNVSMELENRGENKYALTIIADEEFLNDIDTVYPVILDPTISIKGPSETYDSFVSSANPDKKYYTYSTLRTGRDEQKYYGVRRTYINFKLPAALEANTDINITSATLKLKIKSSEGSLQTRAARASGSWSSSSIDWDNAPLPTGTWYNATVSGGWHIMNVTSILEYWVEQGHPRYGFVVADAIESNENIWGTFYSSDTSSSSYRPVLTITAATTSGMNAYSIYGGNSDDEDAWVFSDNIEMCGFPVSTYVYSDSSKQRLIDARYRDFLYWSGHGSQTRANLSYGASGENGSVSWMNGINNVLNTGTGSNFNSSVYWNNGLKWVILAACYQMKNDSTSDARKTWARTMLGSSNPVRSISGYIGSGPTNGDVDIINEYFDIADINGITACWVRANINQQFYSRKPGTLYHNTAWYEFLPGMNSSTSIDTINTNIDPDIRFYYYDNGYNNGSGPLAVSAPLNVSDQTYKTVDTTSGKILTGKESEKLNEKSYPTLIASNINNSTFVNKMANEKYSQSKQKNHTEYAFKDSKFRIDSDNHIMYLRGIPKIDFDLSLDKTKCKATAIDFAKEYFDLPNDAQLVNGGAFLIKEVALKEGKEEKESVVSYGYKFEHIINGVPISSNYGGNSIFVSVGESGVDYAHMIWSDFKPTAQEHEIISETDAVRLLAQDKSFSQEYADNKITTKRLVYSNAFSNYGKEFIPVYEVELEDDRIILINAINGSIKHLSKQ